MRADVIAVGSGAQHRHLLEHAAARRYLQQQGHHVIGIVEMPAEFVAPRANHQVERAQRVCAAEQGVDLQGCEHR